MSKTVIVDSGFNDSYKKLLQFLLGKDLNIIKIKNYDNQKLDLILFTGGADVHPEYYRENIGKYTQVNKKRDTEAFDFLDNYYMQTKNVPKLGICRGSQLLCVMNGGSLIQHVEGHAISGMHKITLDLNQNGNYAKINISSTHHQMMYPFNVQHKLIGWSSRYLSNVYLDGDNKEKELHNSFLEPEIVYFPDNNGLAIQGHPEFEGTPELTLDYIKVMVKQYLNI